MRNSFRLSRSAAVANVPIVSATAASVPARTPPPLIRSPQKVAVRYGAAEAFDSQNSPYFTATDGWGGLEDSDSQSCPHLPLPHLQRAVQHKVHLEHVDRGLAEDAQESALGALGDDLAHLAFALARGLRQARYLVLGGIGGDLGVEP